MSDKQQVDVASANAFTNSTFYGAFSEQQLQTLSSLSEKVSVPKGTVLIEAGTVFSCGSGSFELPISISVQFGPGQRGRRLQIESRQIR